VEGWKNFTYEDCFIYANTDGVPHNACSPVCRKNGDDYVFDIILRNNITTEEYPDGVFHAHPEYHNIKKEGIGLIEAMGLFILPGRLKKQLSSIADILCGKVVYDKTALESEDHPLFVHKDMIEDLVLQGLSDSFESAEARVTQRVNEVCKNILFNTAVFKKDQTGEKGFVCFLNSVNIK
jgi:UDPglucose--hexose-1-phosphate uridylyltransferase